jgi:hypothetical protein
MNDIELADMIQRESDLQQRNRSVSLSQDVK